MIKNICCGTQQILLILVFLLLNTTLAKANTYIKEVEGKPYFFVGEKLFQLDPNLTLDDQQVSEILKIVNDIYEKKRKDEYPNLEHIWENLGFVYNGRYYGEIMFVVFRTHLNFAFAEIQDQFKLYKWDTGEHPRGYTHLSGMFSTEYTSYSDAPKDWYGPTWIASLISNIAGVTGGALNEFYRKVPPNDKIRATLQADKLLTQIVKQAYTNFMEADVVRMCEHCGRLRKSIDDIICPACSNPEYSCKCEPIKVKIKCRGCDALWEMSYQRYENVEWTCSKCGRKNIWENPRVVIRERDINALRGFVGTFANLVIEHYHDNSLRQELINYCKEKKIDVTVDDPKKEKQIF